MALSASALALLAQYGLHAEAIALANGTQLQLLTDVRVVPGKRLVAKAVWQGQNVFAKLFAGTQASRYAQRDQQGILALQAAHIATPTILAFDQVQDSGVRVMLIEAIEDSQNAEVFYTHASSKPRLHLLSQLVVIVAQQHQAGILQTDMYLKNFLVQSSDQNAMNHIYSIDGDGIRKVAALNQHQALQSLSVLLSKIDVMELEQHLPTWLALYTKTRGWSGSPDVQHVQQMIHKQRAEMASRYADRKVFRQCTDVQVTLNSQQFFARSMSFLHLPIPASAKALDAVMQQSALLKDGNTCTVASTSVAGQTIVIKRYNIKNLGHRFSRMWRPSRAAVSWANAYRLQLLAIPTAKPIALLETRYAGLRGKAYFLSEYLDAPDLVEAFSDCSDSVSRAALVKAIVQLCYRLWRQQISHGDLKASNIKVLAGEPVLIDLDSMQQHRYAFLANRAHIKDLQRLMQNWKDDTSLYNAFVKSFKVVYADHAPLKQAGILSD
jgi:tRNA A-37 threonylcarbamoyl transferase component Bud32